MNEIALANFFRVLNNADRFPTEKELAELAIAAKDELNSLRASPAPVPEGDNVSYSRDYALQLCELVVASENLLSTCEVDFFARRDGTADAIVQKDFWNKWVSAVRALKAPRAAVPKAPAAEGEK